MKNQNSTKKPQHTLEISRAVETSSGQQFFLIAKGGRTTWLSAADFAGSGQTAFDKLSVMGIQLLAQQSRNELKKLVENQETYEPALVASQPGWVGDANIYVHPNGEVQRPESEAREVIVTFQPDPVFSQQGKLKPWRKGMKLFVYDQPVISFLVAYGFAALLIRHVEPSMPNLTLELVGDREAGKTTTATLVGTIFGGDPNNDIGIGRSANLTKQSFKPLQRGACDNLLFLDETNLIDKTVAEDLNIFFEQTSQDERARFVSPQRALPVRNCLLMTGNVPLDESSRTAPEKREAARSRYIRIRLRGSVFGCVPQGYDSSHDAFGAMKGLANTQYGSAARAFVAEIIKAREEDADAFASKLNEYMTEFENTVPAKAKRYNRLVRSCALVYAAGKLAKKWRILPIKKTTWRQYCLSILAGSTSQNYPELDRILALISESRDRIVSCSPNGKPPKTAVKNPLGYCIPQKDGGKTYHFLQAPLKKRLGADAVQVLKALRDQKVLVGESGNNSKLSSHPPKSLGLNDRVYRILLNEDQLS